MRLGLLAGSVLLLAACGSVTDNRHLDAAGPGDGSGSAAPCGNGMVGTDEECDDGANNGAGKACNAMCKRNVCGDGDRGPGEMCDNGTSNGENLGDCAPDCSKVIDSKQIILSINAPQGAFGANPVQFADSQCPAGYKALFAFGTARRATTTANETVDPIDWPIHRYTQYVNVSNQVIWKTTTVRLLGVSGGAFTALMNPVTSTAGIGVYTGMLQDSRTLTANNCSGWSSLSAPGHNSGIANLTSAAYLNNNGSAPCDTTARFYCVEQ
jgi:hypothetical protein